MLELTWKPIYKEPERQAVDLALGEGDLGADKVRWRLVPSICVHVESTWKQNTYVMSLRLYRYLPI